MKYISTFLSFWIIPIILMILLSFSIVIVFSLIFWDFEPVINFIKLLFNSEHLVGKRAIIVIAGIFALFATIEQHK